MARLDTHPLDQPTPTQLDQIQAQLQFYNNLSDLAKMRYDADLWNLAIVAPGTQVKADILKRVFTVLYWGGLYFRSDEKTNVWTVWHKVGWPIATALSHGGRVMIQLPRLNPKVPQTHDREYAFLNWLTCSQAGSNVCRERQGTHSIDLPNEWSWMSEDRIKVLKESAGLKHGASQGLGASKGKSYGINLALGGAGNLTFATQLPIWDNGSHGHLYIYFRPQTRQEYGGVLIGCEGEAPSCYGASGNLHSWNIGIVDKVKKNKPSKHEGQFGPKWSSGLQLAPCLLGNQLPLPNPISGPAHFDSLVVDLTATGWEFLKSRAPNFTPTMLYLPALPGKPIAKVPKQLDVTVFKARNFAQQYSEKDENKLCEEYTKLSSAALQLRLAVLTDYKDKGGGRKIMALEQNQLFIQEFDALVRAIYG